MSRFKTLALLAAVRITKAVLTVGGKFDNNDLMSTGDKTPAACEGHPNELACWQRCGTERHSLKECAGICCGDTAPFFPAQCSDSKNGRGGMNCFMDCCTGAGQGLMQACLNSTSPQRARCAKRCCGAKICSSEQAKDLNAEFRQSVSVCYKEFLNVLSEECPAFLGSDYGMIKYSHLVRNFCRSKSLSLMPSSAPMRRALRLAC